MDTKSHKTELKSSRNYSTNHWGKPERAPLRSVVDVGGTSVAFLTIYTTYTVVGWWYKRRTPDNLSYTHGGWLVVQALYA